MTIAQVMKPHLDFVLFQAIFPTLSLNANDIALFHDDPQEFLHTVSSASNIVVFHPCQHPLLL
jgi:hypothetical protein